MEMCRGRARIVLLQVARLAPQPAKRSSSHPHAWFQSSLLGHLPESRDTKYCCIYLLYRWGNRSSEQQPHCLRPCNWWGAGPSWALSLLYWCAVPFLSPTQRVNSSLLASLSISRDHVSAITISFSDCWHGLPVACFLTCNTNPVS